MVELGRVLVFMSWTVFIECKMEPFIVGGKTADLKRFPHAVFMLIKCFEETSVDDVDWICGGSILNELVILTAAHCVYGCSMRSVLSVSVGNVHKDEGVWVAVKQPPIIHEKYVSYLTTFDIALARLKTPLKLNNGIKRIAVMKEPPFYFKAQVAGWGMIDVSIFYRF